MYLLAHAVVSADVARQLDGADGQDTRAVESATAHCAFDSHGRLKLRQGDYISIAASQYPFPTVLL